MRRAALSLLVVAAVSACGVPDPEPTPSTLQVTMPGDTPPAARPPSLSSTPPASPSVGGSAPVAAQRSPWWSGARTVRRTDRGVDVDLPCGSVVTAGVPGTVVGGDQPGGSDAAYGPHPLRVRTRDGAWDVVLGHASAVLVSPGATVTMGTPLLRSGDLGSSQGCLLAVEVRPAGAGTATGSAVDPRPWLRLSPGD